MNINLNFITVNCIFLISSQTIAAKSNCTAQEDSIETEPQITVVYPGDGLVFSEKGVSVEVFKTGQIILIGKNLLNTTLMKITPSKNDCMIARTSKAFEIIHINNHVAHVNLKIESHGYDTARYSICLEKGYQWIHQGDAKWQTINVLHKDYNNYLPFWMQVTVIAVLLILSGLFSGLNLGLMSLSETELLVIKKAGAKSEKKYAERIYPLRKRGNLLLCTLLLGNVMVNSTFTVLFENLTDGLTALIVSTVGIVIFGEIVPQAICSRHGLAVGAQTVWLTYLFMIITFPIAFPISLVLDACLGQQMGTPFNKEKLQELILLNAQQQVLQNDEANMIAGALQLSNKTVKDIMTNIADVYMLDYHTVLDFEKLAEILAKGYTRIPVYENDYNHVIGLLNTKDLAVIDPDHRVKVSTVCKYYDHQPLFIHENTTLDVMLRDFLRGR